MYLYTYQCMPIKIRLSFPEYSSDADILYKQMEWLDGCLISAKGQRPRAVEVVWKQFHQRLAERVKSTDCRQGFSFLSLKLMQKLVELNYRFRPNTETCNEIDERDKDILSYIAGYLIRRTSSRHASSKELVDKDAPPSGMIQLFDRGGLLVPRQGFVDVIIDFENSFRELPRMSVDINQFFKTLDTKGSFVSFQQLFDYRTSFEEQENCFLAITSLFFKVRAHQKCRQIFEKSLRNKSAQQKSKAVRDVLTKS